jgi:RimJ/RimL family protein N-acetyltransferase
VNLAPLFGLRLRTPRLELRVPAEHELERLYEVAAAGIHPPDEMPFGVAWTDHLTLESFLGYHRQLRDTWQPRSWRFDFGVWADGRLVGVQGLSADGFAATRVAATGSWLGRRHQGQGIGTEMRAAVLELAFGPLGAVAVTSSAFAANTASRRVSEKLGYEIVGEDTMSPRGVPQRHLLLRLERERWRGAPFPVELEGAAACLPLFGAERRRA